MTSPSHASALEIDEMAAGLIAPSSHVSACIECQSRLRSVQDDASQVRRTPDFERSFARLTHPQPRAQWLQNLRIGLAGLALAVGITVVVLVQGTTGTDRVKGSASLALVRAGAANGPIRPGERVQLSVGTLGHPYVLVLAVDENGGVEQVWPPGAVQSGKAPSGGVVTLEPGFEVTPGDFVLCALMSDAPLVSETVHQALANAWSEQRLLTGSKGHLCRKDISGEDARAQLFVNVSK